jgi:NodT family efflux transporter outer membrane factor (OMF) lipoprotein
MKPLSISPLTNRGAPRRRPFYRASVFAGAAALALAGCAVGPDFSPPKPQTPATWVDSGKAPDGNVTSLLNSAPVTAVAWWTLFNDAKLNDLVKQAALQNLTVLEADARIRASRASIGIANAGLFPSVNGTGSYSYSSSPTIINDEPHESPPRTFLSTGLNAVWNLDIFGGTRRSVEAAEASVQASIETRRDSLVTLIAEVGADYIQLRSDQQLLQIANTNLADQQHTADITNQRYKAGFAAELDYDNAKSAADSTRAQIPSLQTAIRTDIYALSLLLARPPGALVSDLDAPGPLPQTPPQVPVGLPADLIRRRPDIRLAEATLHSDTANIGVAISAWYPQVSVNGSFGFQGVSIGQLTQWASQTWSWGPTINWAILSGGRISAQTELQRATLQADAYAYQNTVLTALQEVETAQVAFNNEQIRRAALRDAVVDNQKAYDISFKLYQAGSTEFINVLTAELSLASSQNQLAASDAAVATDLVALFKALGGGWTEFPERDTTNLDPFAPAPPSDSSPPAMTPAASNPKPAQ